MTDDPRTVSDEAIEAGIAGERALVTRWERIRSVLLAASREIDCPGRSTEMGSGPYRHPDVCACGGSGKLRVLI